MKIWTMMLAAGVALAASVGAARAEYPDRPITLVVPWGAGGGTDATGRILATLLEKKLGQPINVVNRTGGGSVIGHTEIAKAAPDGYTLGIITTELSMFHWMGSAPISYKDYNLVGLYNADPSTVVVKASSPYKTMEDLAKAIKANSAAVKAGGANLGGLNHLAYTSLVKGLGGAKAFWVPTEGAAPALQLLTSGAIDVAVVQLPEAQGLIDAGELRPIAILGSERNPAKPDLPTIRESAGIDFAIAGWRGLGAPKGLPKDVEEKLLKAAAEVVASQEFKDFMAKRQYGVVWQGGPDFESYLAKRDAAFGEAMTAAGLAKK